MTLKMAHGRWISSTTLTHLHHPVAKVTHSPEVVWRNGIVTSTVSRGAHGTTPASALRFGRKRLCIGNPIEVTGRDENVLAIRLFIRIKPCLLSLLLMLLCLRMSENYLGAGSAWLVTNQQHKQ